MTDGSFQAGYAKALERVEAVLRLVSSDDLTPAGARQIRAALMAMREKPCPVEATHGEHEWTEDPVEWWCPGREIQSLGD